MFRAVKDGTRIDFVLQTAPQPASASLVTPGRPTALAGSDHGNK
jgi:hypothetical protein